LTDPLDVWLYFLRHGQTLDTAALPPALHGPQIRQAMEELQMVAQNDQDRERYEARQKLHRDAISLIKALEAEREEREALAMAQGLQTGEERGIKKGLEEGLKKGILMGRVHLSQRLLQQPLTPETELLAHSSDELTRLAEQLEQQLLIRPQ
jgi:flagellar biosynthesis/type III secretory pathway protein FliH